jgi:hypothetical protein
MTHEIVPVDCPSCGERQNILPGEFDPEKEPFGPVSCMVCNREFNQSEYLNGLKDRLIYLRSLTGPRSS